MTFPHTFNIERGVFDTLFLLYSSPHLLEVRERIRLNGRPLSKSKFVSYFWECYKELDATKVSGGNVVTVSIVSSLCVFAIGSVRRQDAILLQVPDSNGFPCLSKGKGNLTMRVGSLTNAYSSLPVVT